MSPSGPTWGNFKLGHFKLSRLTLKMSLLIFLIIFLFQVLLLISLDHYFDFKLFLNAWNLKLIFILFSSSLLLTLILMWLLWYNFFNPLFFLKHKLLAVIKDIKNPTQHSISIQDKHEFVDIFQNFNIILQQIKSQHNLIKSYEAILALGTEERTQFLDQITHYEPLTGLPNRNLLKKELEKFISNSTKNNEGAFLLILELGDFHEITHAFGQMIGQQFLNAIAKLLKENTLSGTLIAHISTIRFALARNALTSTTQINTIAQLILDLFSKPIHIENQDMLSTINIGIAVFPNDGLDAESLLVNANLALNRAKTQAPNSYQFYEGSMNKEIEHRRTLLVDLHYALEKNQFICVYQPQVCLKTGKLIGFEALIRWQHPEKGLVSPADFIPLAEESGLIIAMGEWILKTACQQLKAWHDQGFVLNIAVNLSAIQFRQKNIVELVNEILIETGLAAQYLELEITESGIMSHPTDAIMTMKSLNALGIMLSVDDFGTGYSSLSYLKQFPVQKLKIDQSFVKGLKMNNTEKPLADIIISLGHSLNLNVIAEGIETEEQLNYLKKRGCDEGQGYYFGKPVNAFDCSRILHEGLL